MEPVGLFPKKHNQIDSEVSQILMDGRTDIRTEIVTSLIIDG